MQTLNNNPGIGFRMTSSRIHAPEVSQGPSPQCYDVRFKLTEREKFQNNLISQRYKNWKSSSDAGAGTAFTRTSRGKNMKDPQFLLGGGVGAPQEYYHVREKLSESEKAQNQLLSQRYQKTRGDNKRQSAGANCNCNCNNNGDLGKTTVTVRDSKVDISYVNYSMLEDVLTQYQL